MASLCRIMQKLLTADNLIDITDKCYIRHIESKYRINLDEMKLLLTMTGLGLGHNELHYNPPIVELILSVRFITTESK